MIGLTNSQISSQYEDSLRDEIMEDNLEARLLDLTSTPEFSIFDVNNFNDAMGDSSSLEIETLTKALQHACIYGLEKERINKMALCSLLKILESFQRKKALNKLIYLDSISHPDECE